MTKFRGKIAIILCIVLLIFATLVFSSCEEDETQISSSSSEEESSSSESSSSKEESSSSESSSSEEESSSSEESSSKEEPSEEKEYIVEDAKGFEVDKTGTVVTLRKNVSNATDVIDLSRAFSVTQGATWRLYKDYLGEEEYKLKSMVLSIGENKAYLIVCHPNGEDFVRYEVVICRADIKEYTFIVDGEVYRRGETEEILSIEAPSVNPKKDGYTFAGWTINGKDVTFPYTIENDTEFVAKLTPNNNTLVFDANGGNGSMSNMTIATDASATLTTNAFTRVGYTFKGWSTSANGGVVYQNGASYTMGTSSTYTLYAVWQANNNTLVFNANGGNGSMSNMTIPTDESKNLTPNAFTKAGYTFKGWATSANGDVVYQNGANYTMGTNSSYTLYAVWETINYDIFYNLNGGTNGANPSTYTVESTDVLKAPTKEYYEFLGWYNGDEVITTLEGHYGNLTLTAKYRSIFEYSQNTITGLTAYGKANYTTLVIPSEIDGNSITSIGDSAFSWRTSLKSITIPNSVTSIGYDAFRGCTSLTSVTIGNSVTSIGDDAFFGCKSLTSVTIGNSVTSIGEYAFRNCTSLTIYCEVESKPSGWNSDWNYSKCPIVWDCNNNEVASDGYVYAIIDGIRYGIKDSVAMVEEQPTYIKEAIIPESITYKGTIYRVTSIGEAAFLDCTSLASVTIPNSVTSIGDYAFKYCTSLTSVTIPNSVTSIGYGAFSYCTSLTSVEIPSSITSIDWYAFSECYSLTIYCEAESQPGGWISSWNSSNRPVVWGHTHSYTNGECVCGAKQN